MRYLSGFFLILLVYTVPRLALATQPVILVLGDSLSAAHGIARNSGWVHLLQERLNKLGYHYRVVNSSVSGDTTGSGVARLPYALKKYHPAVVVIELGGNDGLRGVSADELQRNLTRLVELCKHAGAQAMLVKERIPPNLGEAYTVRFSQRYDMVAAQEQVPMVPDFLRGVADNSELMQDDGLHPNVKGQPLMLDNVWPVLKDLLNK